MANLLSAEWECPSCGEDNKWQVSCAECSFKDSSFYMRHETVFSLLTGFLSTIAILTLTLIVYFGLPIGGFMMLIGTDTVPLLLLIAQAVFALVSYRFIILPLWNLMMASVVAITSATPFNRARCVALELETL